MKKIVFTGGGTAGHIIPNLAIINDIKNRAQIYYIGSNGLEKKLVQEKNIEFFEISSTKLKRSLSFSNLLIPFKLIKAYNEAKKILKKINPDVIFSKGGYVSLPVVLASHKLKIDVIAHESDLTMGLANKICKNKCKIICTSFETTAKNLKNGLFTGSPIRKEIFCGNIQNAQKLFKQPTKKPTILVVGGSLGSKIINEIIFQIIDNLKEFNFIHIVGKGNKKEINKENYVQLEYADNIQDLFALADIVISRAGSNAVNEILALNKPNILIPLSKKASRGDQILNAKYFQEKGYSKVIFEEDLNAINLIANIKNLYKNKEDYIKNMKQSNVKFANEKIIELLLN
ncbi:MAG: undecaprenyldiphospho-muramoylpentapeptide beta-N-acetylglucosaminyltransferase [Christensenellales bacterium]